MLDNEDMTKLAFAKEAAKAIDSLPRKQRRAFIQNMILENSKSERLNSLIESAKKKAPKVVETNRTCCNNPNYVNGFIVWKIFRVKHCLNCGECISTMSKFTEWIFAHVFSKVWNGIIKIETKE